MRNKELEGAFRPHCSPPRVCESAFGGFVLLADKCQFSQAKIWVGEEKVKNFNRVFFCIFILVFNLIFIINTDYACAELRGPVIMGLQLGMPESKVISVLKNIAKEKDLDFDSKVGGPYILSKNGNRYITAKMNEDYGLVFVEFYSIAFNALNVTTNFIKNFLKSYKIVVDRDNIGDVIGGGIKITKPTEGYMLLFSTRFSYIWLQMIDKIDPIEFK